MSKVLDVLVACEESGVVRDAFIKKGHNAISCDLLRTSSPGPHITGDVMPLLKYKWDLIIAHPPCTYLCNSGVGWLSKNPDRIKNVLEAKKFFEIFLNAKCEKICIENPIPHKYGLGKTYSQIIQPWMFGHMERKATCLWLKGLPKLVPTSNLKEEMKKLPKNIQQRLHYLPPSSDRAKLRSKTYAGIAQAMADQWG
jgi:hypothetical protein